MDLEQSGFIPIASALQQERPPSARGFEGQNNNQRYGNNQPRQGNYQGYNNDYKRGPGNGQSANGSSYPRPNNGGSNFQRNSGGNYQRPQEPEGPVELYLPYTISGNREIPPQILNLLVEFVKDLDQRGYTMRTAGREGPEDTFEKAATRKEIHLPWRGFLDKESKFSFAPEAARVLAAKFHPSFDGLSRGVQTFLATDVRVVMGKDLKAPALFLITWSEDGAETPQEKTSRTGNAGQAIAVANALKIPVFNFGKAGTEARLRQYLGSKPNEQQEQATATVQQPIRQHGTTTQGSNYVNY